MRLITTVIPPLLLLTLAAGRALALDPSQPASSYLRTTFTVEDGLPSNIINAIAQTRNGFLWIGTDAGLARFNGRAFTTIDFRGARSSQGAVRSLATSPQGDLWIGTGSGLVIIPQEALDGFDPARAVFIHPARGVGDEITCLFFSRDGTPWVGTNGGLYRSQHGRLSLVLPDISVSRIEQARNGHLLIVSARGFTELDGVRVIDHPGLEARLGVHEDQIFHVLQDRRGVTWFCSNLGIARETGGVLERLQPYGTPAASAIRIFEDAQGSIWVSTTSGVIRFGPAGREAIPGMQARIFYSDTDGNLWIGASGAGLIRFKTRAARIFTTADGLPNNVPMTTLLTHDGRLFVGNNCGGLSLFDGHRFKTWNEAQGLSNSCVWSLAEDANHDIWVGTWGGGLYRFRGGRFTQFSAKQGLAGVVVHSILAARDNTLWVATEDGLSHLVDGRFRTYLVADGLSSNRVLFVFQSRAGRIWAATNTGIQRLEGDRFVSLQPAPDIFDPRYISLAEDPAGPLYALSAPKGVSRVEGDHLVNITADLDLLSMVSYRGKDLWFAGGNGVFRMPAKALDREARLDAAPDAPLDYAPFSREDGFLSTQCSIGAPNMAVTPDGKLWIATVQGLALMDLNRLPYAGHKPAVFAEDVTIGRIKQAAGRELILPPGTHHVAIRFDVVDLTSPEKIRFQYRLDGVDPVWLDADTTRTAVYTNLPFGTHAFHIRACNYDGVWDREGIQYRVTQQPYFYETRWFLALCTAAAAFLIWVFYRRRVSLMAARLDLQFEERLAERTRIARDLHDTLLQSFQGLLFRFQAVRNLILTKPEQALEKLDAALDRADHAIDEGREAIQNLRSAKLVDQDLVEAIARFGNELAAHALGSDAPGGDATGHAASFRVVVEGTPRPLHPMLRDEVYRIVIEALRNAFLHAHAREIEAEIRFSRRGLRLRVRDDGSGIDLQHQQDGGRTGHWGMPRMRERARRMGGRLDVWSQAGAGTEVELTMPGSIAYRKLRN